MRKCQATKQPISGTRIHFVAGLSLHYLPTTLVSLLPGSPHIRYTHILCWWTLALRQQGAHNKWIQIRQEGSLQLQLGLDFPHSEPQTLREACKKNSEKAVRLWAGTNGYPTRTQNICQYPIRTRLIFKSIGYFGSKRKPVFFT